MWWLLGGEEVRWKIWCINKSEELPKLVWGLLVCLPVFSSESWMSRFRWWLGGPIQIHHQITLSRRKPLKRPINKKLWVKEAVSPAFYNDIRDTFGSKKTFQSCGSWNRKQLAKLSTLCYMKLRLRPGMILSDMLLLILQMLSSFMLNLLASTLNWEVSKWFCWNFQLSYVHSLRKLSYWNGDYHSYHFLNRLE